MNVDFVNKGPDYGLYKRIALRLYGVEQLANLVGIQAVCLQEPDDIGRVWLFGQGIDLCGRFGLDASRLVSCRAWLCCWQSTTTFLFLSSGEVSAVLVWIPLVHPVDVRRAQK